VARADKINADHAAQHAEEDRRQYRQRVLPPIFYVRQM